LNLAWNNSGAQGARALATPLAKNASLARLDLWPEGARALAAALETNRTLQVLWLGARTVNADIGYLVADRLQALRISFNRDLTL
jgi:hypothetical protein